MCLEAEVYHRVAGLLLARSCMQAGCAWHGTHCMLAVGAPVGRSKLFPVFRRWGREVGSKCLIFEPDVHCWACRSAFGVQLHASWLWLAWECTACWLWGSWWLACSLRQYWGRGRLA